MKRGSVLFFRRVAGLTFLLMLVLPVAVYGQRRSHRSRIVIYQPQPYVVYQRRPVYRYRTYSQSYYPYANQYYGYSQPYYSSTYTPFYTNRYYNYGYSQPSYVNRYTWV